MTWLEIAANAVTTVSILLAGRGSIHTWWTGIVGAGLFAVLFFDAHLYADVTLQAFFVVTSILGWIGWRQGGDRAVLPVSRTDPGAILACAAGGVVVAMGYGALLHRFTDAYAPFWDSVVLTASVIAQFLLVRRKLECWPFWLLVNSIAVPLYASRGLTMTSALYAVYWINAVVAWSSWRRELAAGELARA